MSLELRERLHGLLVEGDSISETRALYENEIRKLPQMGYKNGMTEKNNSEKPHDSNPVQE